MKSNRSSRFSNDAEFEKYVASLYSVLGFEVTTDIVVDGQQIDLLCEKYFQGIGRLAFAIECKFRSENKIGNQIVQEFFQSYGEITRSGKAQRAILVSNQHATAPAKQVFSSNPMMDFVHIANLEAQVIDPNKTLLQVCDEYEASPLSTLYVPPAGKGRLPGKESKPIPDLEASIIDWVLNENGGVLLITGDFGAGKTSLLQRLTYRLARAALNGASDIRPIYTELKYLSKYRNIDDLLYYSIPFAEDSRVTPLQFMKLINEGNFALFLDGFDEIHTASTDEERAMSFMQFAKLMKGETPIIITSRPTYFASANEINELNNRLFYFADSSLKKIYKAPDQREQIQRFLEKKNESNRAVLSDKNYGILEISAFSGDKILEYLTNQRELLLNTVGLDENEVYATLRNIYDIEDLISRPVILNLMVEMITSGLITLSDETAITGASEIYEIHTISNFKRDFYQKGEVRQLLAPEYRQRFCQLLAIKMLQIETLTITVSEFSGIVEEIADQIPDVKRIYNEQGTERISTDLRVCSFITSTERDELKFTHKSFMEFFVAQSVYDQRGLLYESALFARRLPKEIIYFLSGYAKKDRNFYDSIVNQRFLRMKPSTKSYSSKANVLRRNAACVLLGAMSENDSLDFSDVDIDNQIFTKTAFARTEIATSRVQNIVFSKTEGGKFAITESEINDLEFIDSSLSSVRINSDINGLRINECNIDALELSGDGKDINVIDSSFQSIASDNAQLMLSIEGSSVDRMTCLGMEAGSGIRIRNTEIHSLKLVCGMRRDNGDPILFPIRIDNVRLGSACIVGGILRLENIRLLDSMFQNTELRGCIFIEGNKDSTFAKGNVIQHCDDLYLVKYKFDKQGGLETANLPPDVLTKLTQFSTF